MILGKKTFRYYYWLVLEFVKKQLRIILLSFLLSFIFIVSFISFFPFIQTMFFSKKDIVGLVGEYDINNLPSEVLTKISSGLLFVNQTGNLTPALASSWETTKDASEFRFHLRDGLIWSDGKDFSAFDIPYEFRDVEVKVIDDKTIHFRLKKPLPIFPVYLSRPIIRNPLIGAAGLYKVDSIKSRFGNIVEVSLTPNTSDFPILVYKFYRTETDLINAYKLGEINKLTVSKKSVAEMFDDWKNTVIVRSIDYSRLMTLFFKTDKDFFKEKDLRKALKMAISKKYLTQHGELAEGPIQPISWAYSPLVKGPIFDQIAAEKVIKKNLSASLSAELKFATYYDFLETADEITNDLKGVGLKVSLSLLSTDKPDDFDFLLAFWNVPEDPDQYFFWHSTQTEGNVTGYKNVKVDKLLEDGRNTSNVAERKKYYFEFQKIIADDPPADFLYFPYVYTLKRK